MARQLTVDVPRLRGQRWAVDTNAGTLDVGKHRNQRHLELTKQLVQLIGDEERRESVRKLPGQVGSLSREIEYARGRDTRERHRFGAAAADVLGGERLVAEVFEGRVLERMVGAGGVQHVTRHHRVERQSAESDTVSLQHDGVELQIVTDLANRLVFEQGLQAIKRRLTRNLGCGRVSQQVPAAPRGPMSQRDVSRLSIGGRKYHADNRRTHRGRPIGNDVQGELARRAQLGDQGVEFRERDHQRIVLLDCFRGRREFVHERAERES